MNPELLVGDCRVNPGTGEIHRAGEVVHLEPKSMSVLNHLIEHCGEVVSRDDLLEAIWPGIHVGDDSVTAAIIKIRRALGDDARNPSYVETIPKRGYRLIAFVRARDAPGTPGPPSFPGSGPRRPRYAGLAAVLLLTAVVAVSFGTRAMRDPVEAPVSRSADNVVIAVAAFENASRDPAQNYLARGVGESILTDLAQVKDFTVRRLDPAGPGAEYSYRLEGSVLRAGEVIRVSARLVDVETGDVLSGLRFDRPFADLLTIEDEIRDAVLSELVGSIDAAEQTRQARGYTDNVEAYDLFLQGQRDLLVRTSDTNLFARGLYHQAIGADPNFARAYGGLALTHAAEYRNGWGAEPRVALENAIKYAQTAINISPDLPEQHWVIGYVLTQQRRFAEARAEMQKAIDLEPGFADAFALLGGIETYREDPAASVPLLREAMRLNADAGYLYFLLLARAYYYLGDFEQAEINLDEALARNPENVEAHLYLAATLLRVGRDDDAAWEAMEVMSIKPDFSLETWSETYPMARGAQLDGFLSDLRDAGMS